MIAKITAGIAVDVPDDSDLNEVGEQFDIGLLNSVANFPGGEVIDASVETVAPATQQEIDERGWSE